MQYKTNQKIIIDRRKLEILFRLGCPDELILSVIKGKKITKTGDDLIDENLETFCDFKEFKNWGGNHNPKGINGCNSIKKLGQVDHQDDRQVASQNIGQVVDKDIDIDIDKDKKDKFKNNKYGECKNVLLTEEQYEKLKNKPNFDLAIEKLDTWLGTSGGKYRNKNHFAYFKSNSWVWENLTKKAPVGDGLDELFL